MLSVKKYSAPSAEEPDDLSLFQSEVKGVKPLTQDTYVPPQPARKIAVKRQQKAERNAHASFEFSDAFEGFIPPQGALRYCREDVPAYELKQLRRGDYSPEYILDLHGMTRQQAKMELAGLLHTAKQEHVDCVCLVHGHGTGVLKQALPHYLIQHPQVRAFHQAPLEYGGQGALLVLLTVDSPFAKKR
ncbi:endonuclease SmrB [Marisediminitalea sp.]|uniref:endonuclease SmrB n=1 Tax=Marisediminitalea sp. TaxID=2662268 RepID=UPI000C91A28E|nr:endonuclease SmrB [Alteromonadaceae bacterium]HBY38095.1 endonuclease SmrB [Alteromonas sp.]|tara:strand:+ start:6932 stop:7495 length:564 start_codon:yes stop_codon:yes gene_type:complete